MKNIDNKYSDESMDYSSSLKAREELYGWMAIYSLSDRHIDIELAKKDEKTSFLLFSFGMRFIVEDSRLKDEVSDLSFVKILFDRLQEVLDDETVSYVAKHYDQSLNIFHCGMLAALPMVTTDEDREKTSTDKATSNLIDLAVKLEKKKIERLRNILSIFFLRQSNVDEFRLFKQYENELLLVMEKGFIMWRSEQEPILVDPLQHTPEINNLFYKHVVTDLFFNNNDLVNEERSFARKCFWLGVIAAFERVDEDRQKLQENREFFSPPEE